ncbi:TOMM precursor leader peptide-binding protein [Halorussus sp. MSC15.2]|uniref:TOMM precursor leader peptide-binding protein n=1 Tax=Halorussus sp. MSC15.2 TaxID=2283638 RepID=UPI0013D612B4|nr:TOMM precursor leader peptide-binding protein [Halorussus sp. MSC15.2]NEU55569.1 TOMM precursor leader peptide-binding protein [Halorussus sp. MSC15.2]
MSDEPPQRRSMYPTIDPAIVPVRVTPDKVHFRAGPWSGPVFTLEDEQREAKLADLVGMLDGTNSVADILDEFEGDEAAVRHVLDRLQRKQILDSRSAPEDEPREIDSGFVSEGDLSSVDADRVAVVATGGLGRIVVGDLLDTAVGTIEVVDEESGNRTQAELTADRVERASRSELPRIVEEADVAVLVTDRPAPELFAEVNRLAHEFDTPYVSGQTCGFDGLVGPTVIPGETSCYECFEERRDANLPSSSEYHAFEQTVGKTADSPGPSVAAFDHVVAGLVTTEVLNFLVRDVAFLAGRVVRYDFAELAVETNEVLRMPRCPVCASGTDSADVDRVFTLDTLLEDVNRGGDD